MRTISLILSSLTMIVSLIAMNKLWEDLSHHSNLDAKTMYINAFTPSAIAFAAGLIGFSLCARQVSTVTSEKAPERPRPTGSAG